jgi:hypothetical protein
MKIVKLSTVAMVLSACLVLPAVAREESLFTKVGLAILAEKFGVDPRVAVAILGRSDREVFDSAPCFSASYHTGRPIGDVWKLRQQGLGWGQIAHRLGMNPGKFNKLRKSGAFDRDNIWGSIYREKYGARDADLVAIRKHGGSMSDALPVFIIASKSHSSPMAVFGRYQKERDWDRTAVAYKVDLRGQDHHAGSGKDGEAEDRGDGGGLGEHVNSHKEDVEDHGHKAKHEDREDHGQGRGKGKNHGGDSSGRGKGHGKGG